jgi:PAS domain S-box-containing protein
MMVTETTAWASLFATAFKASRNAMVLADDRRQIVDANGAFVKLSGFQRDAVLGRALWEFAAGEPFLSPEQWRDELAAGRFSGEGGLISADGTVIGIQWGATAETVTGQRLVLIVAMSTSRWGERFRRDLSEDANSGTLSAREAEIVRLVALGAAGPEIADELDISHNTVRTHVRNAMTKLGARSRAHLVAKALGEGHILS